MILQQYLPRRSAEDRIARRVVLALGDDTFNLPVLTIEENEVWRAKARTAFGTLFLGIAALDEPAAIFDRLAGDTELQVALIRTYDKASLLPADEWIRGHASADDLFQAALEVAAAAYPPLAAILDLLLRSPGAISELIKARTTPSSTPTNGQQPSMAGRPRKSARA
jgi:hypothetical protein